MTTAPSPTSCTLTIFEGPDGAGKSTAAQAYTQRVGANYVHLGPFPGVDEGLCRLYAEAMMPAVLGHKPVVMDRSWLSERPYGLVYRDGQDRVKRPGARMLERLALRCSPVVVLCDPGWEAVEASFRRRKAQELLQDTQQLRQVYDLYRSPGTLLPTCVHDYTKSGFEDLLGAILLARTHPAHPAHPLGAHTAGSRRARVLLVGESFGKPKAHDPLYQWPFASFSRAGCSWWLTEQLDQADLGETQLLWANADMPFFEVLREGPERLLVALGTQASEQLTRLGLAHETVQHPQAWKRFSRGHLYPLYPLIPLLQSYLQGAHHA